MKTKIYSILIILAVLLVTACESIEDTYSKYLEDTIVYSPKVRNVRTYATLKEVSLAWDNPSGSIAKKIMIDYQDDTLITETLVDTIVITGLEIKGYTMSIYTMDAFGNLSVPASVVVFPNGE
jgi:hypothetical protein